MESVAANAPTSDKAAAAPTTPGSLGKVWADLTTPAPGLSLANEQKARLLAAVTLVFVPIAAFAILITPVSNFLSTGTFTPPTPVVLIAWGITIAAYFLSRTPNYQWGALAIIGAPIIAATGSVLASTNATISVSVYYFMALSVTLASLLLTAQVTVITGIISIILIVVLSPTRSETHVVELAAVSFSVAVTAISALVSAIRDRNLRALEASQAELQQQVIETDKARERAEQSDKVKSAFLASMSHELRTPMNAIINFTRYVAKGSLGPVNDEQAETLGEVVDSAKHLLNLINDVLDMSKIEAGSLNLFVEDNVNVSSILDSVITLGKSLVVDKPVEIRLEAPDDLPAIRADRQRVLQILLNIMSNACKFTASGTVTLRARRLGSDLELSVQDTGAGIPANDQKAVFEPFKQTSSGLRQGGGTGLGMPISRNLAEAHGGRMWLESEVGKGSTFYVTLPIKSEALEVSIS